MNKKLVLILAVLAAVCAFSIPPPALAGPPIIIGEEEGTGKKTEEKEISFTITKDGEVEQSVNAALSNTENPDQTFDLLIPALAGGGTLIIAIIIFMILRSRRVS